MKTPDYEKDATQAARTLIKFNIFHLPVYPQQLLQKTGYMAGYKE